MNKLPNFIMPLTHFSAQSQQQYGMPPIGDLFKANPQNVQETINSVYFMLKGRIQDIDSRQENKAKIRKAEELAAHSNN